MTDKLKAKIGRDAVEWIQKNLIRECDGMFREPCAEESYTAGAASLLPIIEQMREALKLALAQYLKLANSGDAGFWNPEEEAHVIKSREAIAAYERFVEGEK